jgi:hypothetical protein
MPGISEPRSTQPLAPALTLPRLLCVSPDTAPQLRELLRLAPRKRQTMLFSATFNDDVQQLAGACRLCLSSCTLGAVVLRPGLGFFGCCRTPVSGCRPATLQPSALSRLCGWQRTPRQQHLPA